MLAVTYPWASASSYLSGVRERFLAIPNKSSVQVYERKKERKKTDNPREGWEDGTPPPHRDFKERRVWC